MFRVVTNKQNHFVVQYPDPHFKKRHHKRRIVQAELVETLAALLPTGATVFLQSDVLEVAEAMRDQVSIPSHAPGPLNQPRLPPALHRLTSVLARARTISSSATAPTTSA